MNSISSPFVEAVDGALVPILFTIMAMGMLYLFRIVRRNGYSFIGVEPEAKGAWAITVLFLGLSIKSDVLWLWRHLLNHNETIPHYREIAIALLIAGTLTALWGGFCWVRNVMPVRCSPWAWLAIAVGSVAFGVYFAMP